jgi:hypothetical protein
MGSGCEVAVDTVAACVGVRAESKAARFQSGCARSIIFLSSRRRAWDGCLSLTRSGDIPGDLGL